MYFIKDLWHLKADNIVINLITKEVKIFMNDSENKIKIKAE